MIGEDEIERRLGYHPATPATAPAFELNRIAAKLLANLFDQAIPPGREAALAQTAVQEALMHANAAVACNAGPDWTRPAVDVGVLVDELLEHLEGPALTRSASVGSGGTIGVPAVPEVVVATPVVPVEGAEVLEPAPAIEHCSATLVVEGGAHACGRAAGHDGLHESTPGITGGTLTWTTVPADSVHIDPAAVVIDPRGERGRA